MKKLFTIITLLVSLFFFYSTGVKADTTTLVVSETVMEHAKNEDFLNLREQIIEYCNENNKYYAIYYSGGYYAWVFDIDTYTIVKNSTGKIFYITPTINGTIYRLKDGVLSSSGTFSQQSINLIVNNNLQYINFIDTNIDGLQYTATEEFIIQYNDLNYTITQDSHFPSLYEIYLDSITVPDEPVVDEHEEEKTIVSNFYILVIEKINLFTSNIFKNYIYLTAIVILILIFVVRLIFGRFL